jgi:hypothetical protein
LYVGDPPILTKKYPVRDVGSHPVMLLYKMEPICGSLLSRYGEKKALTPQVPPVTQLNAVHALKNEV